MSDYKIYSGTLPPSVEESIKRVMTFVEYNDGTTASYNIIGELNASSILNKENAVNVVIGTNVTTIGDRAFFWCKEITSVTIPDNVKSIGIQAFYKCYGLLSITIPDSVTSIGGSAFKGCSGLTSVEFEGNAPIIGNNCTYIADRKLKIGQTEWWNRCWEN